jgi:orotate phosphoribosyltransferase
MSTVTDEVAHALYSSGCLKFGCFKIKSGKVSPYYIDLARLLASPKDLCSLAEIAAEKVKEIMTYDGLDKLASIELKGALIVPSIACKVNLPCIIVRKEEKSYGVTGRIAGADISKGDRILFFDDVISEGISKIEGIKPLQELGGNIKHMLVVVNREQGGKENLEKLGYKVHSLSTVSELANSLFDHKHISKQQHSEVLSYLRTFKDLKNTL